jgi:hypothetical protein
MAGKARVPEFSNGASTGMTCFDHHRFSIRPDTIDAL